MLEIVKFIKAHKNWEELLTAAPYNLSIKRDNGYILFKYSQLSSDFSLEICKEARGIIFEESTWKLVRFSFKKFFNIDENYADKIDWNSAQATSKEDGSLMTLWYNNGKWHLSTNSTIDAYKAEISNPIKYKTFGELFDAAAINSGLDYSKLNHNHCYTFELCSLYNRIVLTYYEPKLFHILTRDMRDLKEINVNIGIEKPKIYSLFTEQEYRDCVAAMDNTHEGIVVCDAGGNRVKIKTLSYFDLHRMSTGVASIERIVGIIRRNEQSEFLSYCPQYKERFNNIIRQIDNINKIIVNIKNDVSNWSGDKQERENKKKFATIYGKSKYSALYFAAYDDKLDEIINKMSDNKFIKYFDITEL